MSSVNLPDSVHFNKNGGTYPPFGEITPDDHGAVVITFTWALFSLTGLTVAARFGSRKGFRKDCFCIVASFVLLILQSISIHFASKNGLGRRMELVTENEFVAYSKFYYTSQILMVLTLAFTKMSYFFIFNRIINTSAHKMRVLRIIFISFIVLIGMWGVGTAFALAFQCGLPAPWIDRGNVCVDQLMLYYTISIINSATDILIILIPALIVFMIQIDRSKRLGIWAVFATRILAVMATAVQISEAGSYFSAADRTWAHEELTIWSQVVVNLSVMTACIPLMKPFLNLLQFSLIDASALPFSAPAGMYTNRHKGVSPALTKSESDRDERERVKEGKRRSRLSAIVQWRRDPESNRPPVIAFPSSRHSSLHFEPDQYGS